MNSTPNCNQDSEKFNILKSELSVQFEPLKRCRSAGHREDRLVVVTDSANELQVLQAKQALIEKRAGFAIEFVLEEPERAEPERPAKLKRAVIKEELVALLGDHILALILNQFLYWSERTGEVDKYLKEEARRDPEQKKPELTHGWIYKSGDELSAELMIKASRATMRRYLQKLVELGYLAQRKNPRYKWDRTLQYRPDMRKIQRDLQALGYALEGYKLLDQNPVSK